MSEGAVSAFTAGRSERTWAVRTARIAVKRRVPRNGPLTWAAGPSPTACGRIVPVKRVAPDFMGRFLFWVCFGLLPSVGCADEWWTWATTDFWRSKPFTGSLFLGNRWDFDEGAVVQIVSPRLKCELSPWLDAGLGLSLLNIDFPVVGDQHLQGRPELELNPHYGFGPNLRLDWRNRMEWRWNEGAEPTVHRTRHRLQLGWTLPEPVGPLTRVFVSNEWLLDLHGHGWSENRLVPAGLTLKLFPKADLDVFYLLLSARPAADWRSESVLGTHLRYRL